MNTTYLDSAAVCNGLQAAPTMRKLCLEQGVPVDEKRLAYVNSIAKQLEGKTDRFITAGMRLKALKESGLV